MGKYLLRSLTVVFALALPTLVTWADRPVSRDLPPDLRGLLVKEMQQVLGAAQDIYRALVTGDHATVAERAQAIHDSFILRQSLSAAQRKALHAAVPEAFLVLDRAFHQSAASLAEAAHAQDPARELRFYSRLTAACVDCHRRFADDRFPGLSRGPGASR